jgi:hypothetical protein
MLKTVSKVLSQNEMAVRHHLYNLHPDGAVAAADEEVSFLQIDPACDAAWSQSILHAPLSTQQQQPGGLAPAHQKQAQQQQHQALKQQQQQQVQPQQQQQLPARTEDLALAHTLWEPEQPQQVMPADQGLFSMLPANSIDSCLQQQRHAVLYQPYPGVQQQLSSTPVQQQQQRQQPQQALQQVQDSGLQQQQEGSKQQQEGSQQQQDTRKQEQQGGAQQPLQQEGAQQQDTSKLQQQQQQQQQQAAVLPAEWQHAKQPIAWRCQWLHLRLLELQSLVNLLSAPGSTTHSKLAAGAAAAAAAGDPARASASVAGSSQAAAAAGDTLPVLRVQQQGKLQKQHVDAVSLDSIRQGAFFAVQGAACGSAAAAETAQQQQQAGQPPAAEAGSGAAVDPMVVDKPHQQQQQQQRQAPGAAAAAAGSTPAAAVNAAAAQLCKSVFATPAHPSDAALLFSGLDLVEKQLVSAKLALGKAFGLDVSWVPAGVRLGQYAAGRLQASEGAAAAAAQGQKRSAAAAGLARNAAAAGGGRQLQREGSLAGSQKKRRMERSSLGAVGAISMEEDAVMSPNAGRQMTERPVSAEGQSASVLLLFWLPEQCMGHLWNRIAHAVCCLVGAGQQCETAVNGVLGRHT